MSGDRLDLDAIEAACVAKTGWITGETYCATHGRAAGTAHTGKETRHE